MIKELRAHQRGEVTVAEFVRFTNEEVENVIRYLQKEMERKLMTGSGTQADPYIISDVDDLQAIEDHLASYYELGGDIDASATIGWNGGLGFDPLGTGSVKFTGQLDGKGYTVTSLSIDRSSEVAALFHYIGVGGVVKNLGLVDCSIRAEKAMAAALVIYNEGTITNCYSTGTVTAWGSGITTAGGLVKDNYAPGVVEDSYSSCTVNSNFGSGGFATLNESIIRRCYATGNVTDTNIGAAGFVDYNEGEITQCYATGNVHATGDAAGFVRGQTTGAVIRNCYARGNVLAERFSGQASGFIGNNYSTGIVEDCYAANVPTATGGGTAKAYGFCYYMYPDATGMSNCFWDTDVSGITDPSPYVTGETGKTTAEMKTRATFTDAGWDFTTPIWYIHPTINDGYPAFIGVVTRIKGNPNIDQIIYQHVERMD